MNGSPETKWDSLKGIVKKKWKDLTEEDFKQAEGSLFKLYGVIRTKSGGAEKPIKDNPDLTDHE